MGRSQPLKVVWVKGDVKSETLAAKWNQWADHLASVRGVDGIREEWERLAEWLHIKQGHLGKADLYHDCWSQKWPVSMATCEAILTACPQCPNKA